MNVYFLLNGYDFMWSEKDWKLSIVQETML